MANKPKEKERAELIVAILLLTLFEERERRIARLWAAAAHN